MIDRLGALARVFSNHGCQLALETGQESSAVLKEILDELSGENIGVNFDPANMILYGMGNPVNALQELSSSVLQIHIKDAHPTQCPGTWGEEVPVGSGAVDWIEFFKVYDAMGLNCDLMIEREAGDQREDDIAVASSLVTNLRGMMQ